LAGTLVKVPVSVSTVPVPVTGIDDVKDWPGVPVPGVPISVPVSVEMYTASRYVGGDIGTDAGGVGVGATSRRVQDIEQAHRCWRVPVPIPETGAIYNPGIHWQWERYWFRYR